MNEDTNRKQCKICHGYLFDDDDIVVCPVCGAPHHRDCWNTVGHCGLDELHGTEKQYDSKKETESRKTEEQQTKKCEYCGRESHSADGAFCPYCGQSYSGHRQNRAAGFGPGIISFDICGGIPPETVIDDGVTVKEAAQFVGSNSPRYMHKFVSLNKKNKRSWNWAAFLFPAVWNFSRKMYTTGVLYLILTVAAELCLVPLNSIISVNLGDSYTRNELFDFLMNSMSTIGVFPIVLTFASLVLNIVPMIISGITADWSYRNFSLKKISAVKSDGNVDDIEAGLHEAGNISLLWLVVSLFATSFLSQIIAAFLIK